eukprot:3828261-Pyramimonas_sp.AAC.1
MAAVEYLKSDDLQVRVRKGVRARLSSISPLKFNTHRPLLSSLVITLATVGSRLAPLHSRRPSVANHQPGGAKRRGRQLSATRRPAGARAGGARPAPAPPPAPHPPASQAPQP